MRYHVNISTGKVSQCRAREGNCPLKTAGKHFENKAAAEKFSEALMKISNSSSTTTSLRKKAASSPSGVGNDVVDVTSDKLTKETTKTTASNNEKVVKKTTPRRTSTFDKKCAKIKDGLKKSGIVSNTRSLPRVENEKEMIDKWFAGDAKKYNLIKKNAGIDELKPETIKAVGRLTKFSGSASFAKNMDDLTANTNATDSNVDFLDDFDWDIKNMDPKNLNVVSN